MNCLTKQLASLLPMLVLFPLSGCASRPDYTLNPPASTEWVTVAVKFPPETEVVPLDVLYRSESCRREDYDPTTESHVRTIRGFNPVRLPLNSPDSSGVRKVRVALEGGTKCGWTLSGIRLGIQLSKSSSLVKGDTPVPSDYVFDFDDEGYSSAFGQGKPKKVSGNISVATDFFPVISHHRDNEVSIKLFGGDIRYDQWKRYFRVSGTNEILIQPIIHIDKVVTVVPPNPPPGDLIATYPDGSTSKLSYIYPDYGKLLSMK
ncbi:hypothetical protein ACK2EI_003492 [Salmonella enterica]